MEKVDDVHMNRRRKERFPMPKQYWLCIGMIVGLFTILFASILHLTRVIPREVWAFTQVDWQVFIRYAVLWIMMTVLIFVLSVRAGTLNTRTCQQKKQHCERFRYAGIGLTDYAYIWIDDSGEERALIAEHDGKFLLTLQAFDAQDETWQTLKACSEYSTLADVKEALLNAEFYCEANGEPTGQDA